MEYSHPESKSPLILSLALSLLLHQLLPLALAAKPVLTYNNGPLLTGEVNLSLLFYGQIGRVQKAAIRNFIRSLNTDVPNLKPEVSSWWQIIESYQAAANKNSGKSPKIEVRVVSQVVDHSYSIGKSLITTSLPNLVQKATGGKPNTVAVIFAAKDVKVQDACTGKCFLHGVLGKQPYIVVGNPENECPGTCAWPFHREDNGPQGITLQPPSGNVGADVMVMHFAAALAATVTNPYNTGFSGGAPGKPIEAATACPGMFGIGAFPGYTGRVHVDPHTGGGFNAHGYKGMKFLLPALWNPKTSLCWTTM